ncbi:MAG TPA: hypothetical protein VEW69_02110 [Alphaproteobacteria bacterium]|nr:hypothetical protein [Alphaproteobacteria bacterium]
MSSADSKQFIVSSLSLLVGILTALLPTQSPAQQATNGDPPPTRDPKEIVRRAVEINSSAAELSRNYTYQRHEVKKHLGPCGEVKSSYAKTWDVTNLYGEPYSRLIEWNGKPLSERSEKREEEKLERFFDNLKDESEEHRQRRQAKERKQRDKERAFFRDVVNAYDFHLVGEEVVDAREVWVIEATPAEDFHPTQPYANFLPKLKGKVWIDKQDYTWVKVEAEAITTIPLGLFVARIHKGTRFGAEQTRLNDEIWLKRRFYVEANARVLLISNRGVELEDTFSNYRKFSTKTKILPGAQEVEK